MREQDRKRFARAVSTALGLYGKEVDQQTLKAWWNILARYGIEDVERGFEAFLRDSKAGRYAPTPAAIIGAMEADDGRPGAEQAWTLAVASFDEAATVCLSEEIFSARNLAGPLYEAGDRIGARMAFKQYYEDEVRTARANRRPAKWTMSLGTDKRLRTEAVKRAKAAGLIGAERARELLPNPSEATGAGADVAGLLAGNVLAFPEGGKGSSAREKALREIKKKLGG